MHKLGLKLWSINTDNYIKAAQELFEASVFDYIELYVVPQSLEHLEDWQKLDIPYIIHCPHFANGFNLAKKEKKDSNLKIYQEVKKFADELSAPYIIFHGGIDGNMEETAKQLASFDEPRALIENKPYVALPNKMNGNFCRGYNVEEIELVKKTANCGFCLDIGHAICSANSQKIEPYSYIKDFLKLEPTMFHLTDCADLCSEYDSHLHLGDGELNIAKIIELLPKNALITLETIKNSKENLDDFIQDCNIAKNI